MARSESRHAVPRVLVRELREVQPFVDGRDRCWRLHVRAGSRRAETVSRRLAALQSGPRPIRSARAALGMRPATRVVRLRLLVRLSSVGDQARRQCDAHRSGAGSPRRGLESEPVRGIHGADGRGDPDGPGPSRSGSAGGSCRRRVGRLWLAGVSQGGERLRLLPLSRPWTGAQAVGAVHHVVGTAARRAGGRCVGSGKAASPRWSNMRS